MSSSFAATERNGQGPRVTVEVPSVTAPTGFFARIRQLIAKAFGFVKTAWSFVTRQFSKVVNVVKAGAARLSALLPEPIARFVPVLGFVPFVFRKTWSFVLPAIATAYKHTIGWVHSKIVDGLTALASAAQGWPAPARYAGLALTTVVFGASIVAPVAVLGLTLFGKISVLTGTVLFLVSSPTFSDLAFTAHNHGDQETVDFVESRMTWFGRLYALVAAGFALVKGSAVTALVSFPLFALAALTALGVWAYREYVVMSGKMLLAVARGESMTTTVENPVQASAEPVLEVVPSKLNKGYDSGKKMVHVIAGHDIDLSSVSHKWDAGFCYVDGKAVAIDLRSGLKPETRDARRTAFLRMAQKAA